MSILRIPYNKKEILITKGQIEYNSTALKFDEISDFSFDNRYFNGMGGLTFIIRAENKRIDLSLESFGILKRINQTDLDVAFKLYNELRPVLYKNYAINKITKIINGEVIIVANMIFKKDTISIKNNLFRSACPDIPYNHATLIYETLKYGLVGTKGQCQLLTLRDDRNKREYRYTKEPLSQPTHDEMEKAKFIFEFIKKQYI